MGKVDRFKRGWQKQQYLKYFLPSTNLLPLAPYDSNIYQDCGINNSTKFLPFQNIFFIFQVIENRHHKTIWSKLTIFLQSKVKATHFAKSWNLSVLLLCISQLCSTPYNVLLIEIQKIQY